MLKILKNKQENIEEEEIFIHQPLTDQGPQRWQQKHCGAREHYVEDTPCSYTEPWRPQVTSDFWASISAGWLSAIDLSRSLAVVLERFSLDPKGSGGTLLCEDRVRGNSWERCCSIFAA